MITQDLGIATAYGYAKSKGYTGTEAEFAELMASYASTAQTAIEAADRAVEANTAAQSAKTDAQSSASTASTAAQTATSKASEAVTAAGTATTKASEASTSASTASSAATSAGTSAQTATAKAGTATAKADEAAASEAAALSAKTDAESARDAAAQSASEAAASAESIDPATLEHRAYGAYVVESATGSIASFADGADSIPMKDVLVHIEPVQAGSGDPSPDNVRPITGWTGAEVMRTGKNLLDIDRYGASLPRTQYGITWKKVRDGVYHVSGTATSISYFNVSFTSLSQNAMPCTSFIGQQLRLSTTDARVIPALGYFMEDGTFMDIKNGNVLPDDATGLRAYVRVEKDTVIDTDFSIQLELGSTATDYEPYAGQTHDITFPSEAGTVYGGYVDVLNGELVVDRAQIASYNGETLPSTWISDRDVYSEGATPTTGAQVCYELATPITYQLTPQEITSLLGDNNIWADTGGVSVEYRADVTLYINKKITEAVSALS